MQERVDDIDQDGNGVSINANQSICTLVEVHDAEVLALAVAKPIGSQQADGRSTLVASVVLGHHVISPTAHLPDDLVIHSAHHTITHIYIVNKIHSHHYVIIASAVNRHEL